MTDLTKGILDINGFVLSRDTAVSDFSVLPAEDVKVQVSKLGNTYVRFLKPVHSNGVDVYVEVYFYTDAILPEIKLFPAVPQKLASDPVAASKYKVSASKKWLKGMIEEAPTSEGVESILYSYDWGYIHSATYDDPHYCLIGGEIEIIFREG